MRIDIIADTVCPWCFVGKRRLERALAHRPVEGLTVGWHPFQLNPNMPREGKDRRSYLAEKFGGADRARARYQAIEAAGIEEGIEFRFELIQRTPNTVDSHRLIRFAAAENRQSAVVEGLFRAYFTEGRDIGSVGELADIGAEAGLRRRDVRGYLDGVSDRDIVLAEDELARGMGVGGVPCYIVDRRYAISGAQSPEVFYQIFDLARQDAQDHIAAE